MQGWHGGGGGSFVTRQHLLVPILPVTMHVDSLLYNLSYYLVSFGLDLFIVQAMGLFCP